jgi:hypothetical protein
LKARSLWPSPNPLSGTVIAFAANPGVVPAQTRLHCVPQQVIAQTSPDGQDAELVQAGFRHSTTPLS